MIWNNVKMITTPVPLPCGCILTSAGISFCAEAKRLWDQTESTKLFARQAESAGAWQKHDDAYAAYKNHFERKM